MGGCGLSGQPHVVAGLRHDSGGPSGDTWRGASLSRALRESGAILILKESLFI